MPPDGFTGHSMSVSDIIVLQRGGAVTSHYVNEYGFADLPAFLGNEKQPRIAVQTMPKEASTPTVHSDTSGSNIAELEAKVKAGEAISITDLANAVNKDGAAKKKEGKISLLGDLADKMKIVAERQPTAKHDEKKEVRT
jgi:hypothetical protein